MTAFGTVERAVKGMKEGAYDFVSKPIKRAQILKSARQAWSVRRSSPRTASSRPSSPSSRTSAASSASPRHFAKRWTWGARSRPAMPRCY